MTSHWRCRVSPPLFPPLSGRIRMPNLLYIGENPANATGSPIIVLRHLRRFAADGWSVGVLADYFGDYRECERAGWRVGRLCHRRWWWPPYRERFASLRWIRLRLLALESAALFPPPDAILCYFAAHSDLSADLATHVARITGAPLHILVHDDATAFPAARGREAHIREAHERILRAADQCWFASPELADCFPSTATHRRVLYPIPEGFSLRAEWRADFGHAPRVYYAGSLWPEQLPLLGRVASIALAAGARLVLMARESPLVRAWRETAPVEYQPPFPTNREALAHLAAHAAGVVVSYADTVSAMPWCATSFPSKLVEYAHLGLPVAIVAPRDSAVASWVARTRFPHHFEPADAAGLRAWFATLADADAWRERAALSLQLARTEFNPGRIHAQLAAAFPVGTEGRAA